MPDSPPAATGGKKSTFGFLGKKIGPVPIWVIMAAAVAGYYWYFHYGPGAKNTAAAAQATAKPAGQQPVRVTIYDYDRGEHRRHTWQPPNHRITTGTTSPAGDHKAGGGGTGTPPDLDASTSMAGAAAEPPAATPPPPTRWRN